MRLGGKWAAGLLCALAVLACGAYRWPVGSTKASAEIDAALSSRFGLHWRGPARATLALLPWPTLRVRGVELVDADEKSALTASSALFSLSLQGLLGGRFVPTGATLRGASASIDLDAAPLAAAAARFASGAGSDELFLPWPHVRLQGGALHIVSAAHRFDALIENVEGTFDWSAIDAPMNFALAGAWRDENVQIEGRIDNPWEGLRKRSTGVMLSIASRPLAFAVNGTWGGDAVSGFAGDVSGQIRSLAALGRLFGADPAPLFVGDALSFAGKAQTNGASLALSDARFEFVGQRFDGALTLSRENARTTISGTLAADSLKIEPLIGAPPTFVNAQGDWSAERFAFAPPRGVDLDLRISAAHADWSGHRIDDAAGSLICKDGEFTATLLQAAAYQGVLKGEITLARETGGLETQLAGSLADADIGAALADFGWSGYRGRGGFDFSLRSTGLTPADSVASLAGVASLDLQSGVIEGVSVEEAMRRGQRRPIDVARDMAAGQTTFTRARAQFVVANGTAQIRGARVEGPGSALAIEGSINIAARELDTRLAATQADAEGAPSADAARLTIVVAGPWSAPSVAALPGGG
jgi:AsmA protein